jgi:predicted membrane protein
MGDTSLLVWGMLFGSIGLGFLVYGRRQRAIVPLMSGLALLLSPLFISNVYILVAAGVALVALPCYVRI